MFFRGQNLICKLQEMWLDTVVCVCAGPDLPHSDDERPLDVTKPLDHVDVPKIFLWSSTWHSVPSLVIAGADIFLHNPQSIFVENFVHVSVRQ